MAQRQGRKHAQGDEDECMATYSISMRQDHLFVHAYVNVLRPEMVSDRQCVSHLAVQLAGDVFPIPCVVALIVDSEAGGDIPCQPVQADISQQEVFGVGHLAVAAPPI